MLALPAPQQYLQLPAPAQNAVRHVVPISGKDSLATAIVAKLMFPEKQFDYFYNQVGSELPEVFEWLEKVEAYLGQPIIRVGKDLKGIIKDYNFLPSHKQRFCTRQAKIEPMEAYLNGYHAVVYFGIRADENRTGYRPSKNKIYPVYPLQQLGLGLDDVWKLCEAVDLLPPQFFWQDVYNRVVERVPCEWIEGLSPWETSRMFAWRSRPNCSHCFYQRQYEFIGLFDHHPDLFWEMVNLEETTGSDEYTIREGYKMRDILIRREAIVKRRVDAIVSQLGMKYQKVLFPDFQGSFEDEMKMTSCGLFCGK